MHYNTENMENMENTENIEYKHILTGTNARCNGWQTVINNINKYNVVVADFRDIASIKVIIFCKNIKYIVPLSDDDYDRVKNANLGVKIIYPTENIHQLLHNKLFFTGFMYKFFCDCIPKIYYLNNKKIANIEFPAIYKPIYSTNGDGVKIIWNQFDLATTRDKYIIQEFIEDQYEYGAFMLCIDGQIINWKIIGHKYDKHYIKNSVFPENYDDIDYIDINVFAKIIKKINYSGGMCIDFKFDKLRQKVYIFEMNPRFGGSAFSRNFIYELLCIK